MVKLISISRASEYLGVSPATLRRWEKSGKIRAAERTLGKQRRYDVDQLKPYLKQHASITFTQSLMDESLVRELTDIITFFSTHFPHPCPPRYEKLIFDLKKVLEKLNNEQV